MADKRFWSGAIIVATVVVAGASALPALLLAPGAPEPMIPIASAATEKKAERVVAPIEPSPVPAQAAQVAAVPPPAPPPPVAPPPASVREAAPVAFPPVQPVGIATGKIEPVPVIAAPAPPAPRAVEVVGDRPVIEKPVRAQRTAAQRATKPKRQAVRPAVFPLREFLAWRR